MRPLNYLIGILAYVVICSGCGGKNDEILELQEYTGPIVEIENAVTFYSDSARVKMRMEAPLQLEFGSGDREFPKGLFPRINALNSSNIL